MYAKSSYQSAVRNLNFHTVQLIGARSDRVDCLGLYNKATRVHTLWLRKLANIPTPLRFSWAAQRTCKGQFSSQHGHSGSLWCRLTPRLHRARDMSDDT
eukprot:4147505-Amphidinium_carterae.2